MTEPISENEDFVKSAKSNIENASRAACEKVEDAWRVGSEQVRENPIPILVGVVVVGAIIGLLLSRREPEPPAVSDAVESQIEKTRQWAETLASQIADKVSASLPRKGWFSTPHEPTLLEQAQEVVRKLKFW